MATRVESQRNLVGVQSISFIRAITLTLRLSGARPNTQMYVFFDGIGVNEHCAPIGGTFGQPIVSDSSGSVTATFAIPGGTFRTGTREVVISDATSLDVLTVNGSVYGSAKAIFTSNGVQQLYQTSTTVTDSNTIVVEQIVPLASPFRQTGSGGGNSDPLAQSFFTYGIKGGCYLTSIDLYFNTKDESVPVRVDIRPMINGLPQAFSPTDARYICIKNASDVNVSSNASIATNFKFDVPVYLEEDKDYCFVVFSNSKNYNLFTSKLGEKSFETGKIIFEQPYSGSLFKSENNITWQPEQFEDIKFNLNIANFSTSTNGVVKLKAISDFFGISGQYVSTTSGQQTVRINQTVQHGLDVNSKIYVAVDSGAVYNGIPAANLSGERTITAIIDEYTYEFDAASSASVTGSIATGGQVREIQVDSGGTGYTSAPTVTVSGDATATATVLNGKVVRVSLISKGSGYTSAPTVTFSGGGGIGAEATAIIEAGFSVNANKPTNFVVSNIPAYAAPDAAISAKLTTTQLNYVGGNLNTYSVADVVDMTLQGRTYLNTNSVIASRYNEISRMGGNPSTLIEYSLNTTNPNVSPVIDIRNSPSLISYNYRMRNQSGEDLRATTSTGVVSQLIIQNNGSGYTVAPTISFIGDGTGAAATALLGTTAVSSATITAGGTGYTSAPTITFSGGGGTGAEATAILAGTSIASIAVTSGGTGYTVAPSIIFSGGGGGTGAEATAVLSTASIASIGVSTGGTGYTSAPTVTFSGGGGTGAEATAILAGTSIASIAVTSGGTGYTVAPSIIFSGGGGGTGAEATAVLSTASIASIGVSTGGTGYTSAPTVTFSGGGGTGATATATVSGGAVTAITVTSAGTGYTSAPTVSLSGGGGTGATATAVLTSRNVASITLVNGGTGYTVAPSLIFSGGGGTGAAATATLSARAVSSISLVSGGTGYTSAPTVTLSGGGGTGAEATASIAGRNISEIVITDPGSNYSQPPEVVITRTDASTGVDAIATSVLTTFNSELSANRGTALSRYITKKFTLQTPSTGINIFSEIYSEQQSGVDWYIRTSKSGSGVSHDSLEWKILKCDQDRNLSSKRGEVFDYKFYLYDIAEFDTYDLKCVLRSSNPTKAPEVNNYRVIIVA